MASSDGLEGEYAEALETFRDFVVIQPDIYYSKMADTLNNLATLHSDNLQYEQAGTEYAEALEIYRNLAATQPDVYRPDVALALNNMAILHQTTRQYEQAEAEYVEALEIRKELTLTHPAEYDIDLCRTTLFYGKMLIDTKLDVEKGWKLVIEALQIAKDNSHPEAQGFVDYIERFIANPGTHGFNDYIDRLLAESVRLIVHLAAVPKKIIGRIFRNKP
jgi:tetratricopeptide (TPR) repeat protein